MRRGVSSLEVRRVRNEILRAINAGELRRDLLHWVTSLPFIVATQFFEVPDILTGIIWY